MTEQQDTKIHKIVVDAAYQEAALNRIRRMVSGNKFDPANVLLQNFEGEVLQFQAETLVDVTMSLTRKIAFGKLSGSVISDSEDAARELIRREYVSLMQDAAMIKKIRDIFTSRDDKGFGKTGLKVPLKFWRKSFVIHQQCPDCKRLGRISCNRCGGSGTQTCGRCYGSGYCTCHNCNGGQTVSNTSGGRMPCPICYGRGKISCPPCRQSGKSSCPACLGKGALKCSTCNGLAWISIIQDMFLEAITKFDYPHETLPEKVANLIKSKPESLSQYAEIHVIDQERVANTAKEERIAAEQKIFRVSIGYSVILPYSHLSFDIKGKTYYTFLFGIKGHLSHVSPFLDDLLAGAFRALEDAVDRRGDTLDNLKKAAEFRTAREAIILSTQLSLPKAVQLLLKQNPLGLSETKANVLVQQANLVLGRMTKKALIGGFVIAETVTVGLLAGYFLTAFRPLILSMSDQSMPALITDVLFAGISLYIGMLTLQAVMSYSLKSLFQKFMPEDTMIPMFPKLGKLTVWHSAIAIGFAGGILEVARQGWARAPGWYIQSIEQIQNFLF